MLDGGVVVSASVEAQSERSGVKPTSITSADRIYQQDGPRRAATSRDARSKAVDCIQCPSTCRSAAAATWPIRSRAILDLVEMKKRSFPPSSDGPATSSGIPRRPAPRHARCGGKGYRPALDV